MRAVILAHGVMENTSLKNQRHGVLWKLSPIATDALTSKDTIPKTRDVNNSSNQVAVFEK